MAVDVIEQNLDGSDLSIGVVVSRFNEYAGKELYAACLEELKRLGVAEEDITYVTVPGALEIPFALSRLAETGDYDALIALGAVIRGATPHFDYVCSEASKGIAQVMLQSKTPIGFGLLTCDSIEQAIERAGSKGGNKGVEAAAAMLETIRVLEQL